MDTSMSDPDQSDGVPEIVFNLHLLERCNYRCRYCFRALGVNSRSLEILASPHEGAQVIGQLADAGRAMHFGGQAARIRFNFVGGEPGLVSSLPELVHAARFEGARGRRLLLMASSSADTRTRPLRNGSTSLAFPSIPLIQPLCSRLDGRRLAAAHST